MSCLVIIMTLLVVVLWPIYSKTVVTFVSSSSKSFIRRKMINAIVSNISYTMVHLRSVLLILVVLFLIFLIALPVKYVLRLHRRKKRLLKYVSHLPSPNELPIVGSGLRFVWKNSEGIIDCSSIIIAH